MNFDSCSKICSKCTCTYLGYTWPPVRFSNYFFLWNHLILSKIILIFRTFLNEISNDLFEFLIIYLHYDLNLSLFFLFCWFSVSITLDNFLKECNSLNYDFLNNLFNYGFLNKYRTLYRINALSLNTSRQLFQIEWKNDSVGWMWWFIILHVFWCRISVERI